MRSKLSVSTPFIALIAPIALLALVGLGLSGCNQATCTRSTDCQGSLVCDSVGACVVPPDLAGTKTDVGDGGDVDAGATADLATIDDGAATTD